MAVSEQDAQAAGHLLDMIGPEQAAAVRLRLGVGPDRVTAVDELSRLRRGLPVLPASVLLWLLECDLPEINEVVFHEPVVGDAIRRDILAGVPFGPGRTGRLPVPQTLVGVEESGNYPGLFAHPPRTADELIPLLRTAGADRSLVRSRRLAGAVPRAEWGAVARADEQDPFPGYARWALATHVTCPQYLRDRFGSHPKFLRRLRQAGILVDADDCLDDQPAWRSLLVIAPFLRSASALGERIRAVLAPLVQEHLGGHAEAWAVLVQLRPTFAGTLPELIVTAGAIAGPDPRAR
jgi:hypothetical protein